ncbi:hypothetical protein KAR91_35985, partial [Candidatus Pacearchaeota archaeon]|nr:hypothetical protein [Candidatus Pacearchaeota archaeon]
EGIDTFASLREAYVAYTDDDAISGMLGAKAVARLREADATTFNYALGFSMQRRMLKDYKDIEKLWKKIAVTTPIPDFKLQERIRWGGFGVIPTVQAARTVAGTPIDTTTPTYPELGFPQDQEATYAVATKGGIVTITRRMIIDDDLRVLVKLPMKIGKAAAHTLNAFVFDLMLGYNSSGINAATIYDTLVLYHDKHKNKQTTALSHDNLATLLDSMYYQTEWGNQTLAAGSDDFDTDAAATTVNVTTGEGQYFKSGDFLWCEGEIMRIDDVSTDALTIVRGLFGTTAATHADGVIIYKVTQFLALDNPNLWLPRSLRTKGLELKNSEKNPESAEGADNTIRDLFTPQVSPYLRGDENNYYLSAQPSDVEGIEIGFLNGREEPELFLQDQPTVGNVFVYDQIRYKLRHEYGGAVVDFRPFAASIVS